MSTTSSNSETCLQLYSSGRNNFFSKKVISEIRNRFAEEEARAAALAALLQDAQAKDAHNQMDITRLQRKEEIATTSNKELKIELETQKTAAHRELSRAKGMISKMKDERDVAVQRELQISMQRHASATRGSERQASAVRQHVNLDSKSTSVSSPVALDRGAARFPPRFSATLPDFATVARLLREQEHAGEVVAPSTARSSSSSEGTGDEAQSAGAVATPQAWPEAAVTTIEEHSEEEKWKQDAPLRLKQANEEIARARDIEDDLKTTIQERSPDSLGVDGPGVEVDDGSRLSREERRRRWQEEIRLNGRASASFITDLFGPSQARGASPGKFVEVPIEHNVPAVGIGIAITNTPP